MEVTVDRSGEGVVVEVSGDVDAYTSPGLRKHLVELVKQKTNPIRVSLAEVNYMDSSGIATLVEALQGIRKYKGDFVLINVQKEIRSILELARLDRIFTIQ